MSDALRPLLVASFPQLRGDLQLFARQQAIPEHQVASARSQITSHSPIVASNRSRLAWPWSLPFEWCRSTRRAEDPCRGRCRRRHGFDFARHAAQRHAEGRRRPRTTSSSSRRTRSACSALASCQRTIYRLPAHERLAKKGVDLVNPHDVMVLDTCRPGEKDHGDLDGAHRHRRRSAH